MRNKFTQLAVATFVFGAYLDNIVWGTFVQLGTVIWGN